jgi:SAM-dependent methyltransferase
MLHQLPDAGSVVEPEPFAGPDHPMRRVTREVAFERAWSAGRAAEVTALFDSLAGEWAARQVDGWRTAPVRDALLRGGLPRSGRWLELGSGTGAGTAVLHGEVPHLVAVDLSAEMLCRAPALVPRVQADGARLPFEDGTFDVVLLLNMLLFPDELDRVISPRGRLLWINTRGDQTPIHLPPHDVIEAMPGTWGGTTARAGSGFWAVLSRIGP